MIYVVICKDKFSIFAINLYFMHASQQIKVSVRWIVSYKSHLKTESLMAAALLKDDELIFFDHDIITIIRKIKNQHHRVDTNNIHKKIIKIPDYRAFYQRLPQYSHGKPFKNGRVKSKPNRGSHSLTLNDVKVEIPIHDDSYSVSHFETSST